MTNEEAIECLKRRLKCAEYVDSDYCDSIDLEAIKIAIGALKKQIPAKLKRNAECYNHVCCPNCGSVELGFLDEDPELSALNVACCWQCGQRIDFENENN